MTKRSRKRNYLLLLGEPRFPQCRAASQSPQVARTVFLVAALLATFNPARVMAQTRAQAKPTVNAECRVESVDYKGWQAQQVSNRWVQLVIVPQNGGRLMQVSFHGHAYLFVNPKLAGKYMPPAQDVWFNYGGDKLWLLPEGNEDEQHWRGNSDLLDDGPFTFRKLSEGEGCGIELIGPPDPHTGIQFSRTIRLNPDSPHIAFHASMKNVSGHTVEWSMQSVSQYDTGDGANPSRGNREFWGFTPTNRSSGYLNRYHVRYGPAENPAASVRDDGLFSVHYVHLAAEFWVDSNDGWLAVVDGSSRYAMVERFQYQEQRSYPGKASVIFWTNGPELRLADDGVASVSDGPEARLLFTWKRRSIARCAACVRGRPANWKPIGSRREPRANSMELLTLGSSPVLCGARFWRMAK